MTISVGERATTMVVALATSKALRQRAALVASSFSRSRFVFLDIFRCRQLRRRRGPFLSGASFGEIILPEHSRRHRTIRPPRFCQINSSKWQKRGGRIVRWRRECSGSIISPNEAPERNGPRRRLSWRQRKMSRNTNRLRLKLLATSAALCLSAFDVANATTIVVARSPTEIVMAADSKVTDTYGNELNSQVCKIQQVGNLFLAFEGLLRDRATGFSVPEIALRALQLKPEASAQEKVNILTGFLTSELFAELQRVRTNSPDEFHTRD